MCEGVKKSGEKPQKCSCEYYRDVELGRVVMRGGRETPPRRRGTTPTAAPPKWACLVFLVFLFPAPSHAVINTGNPDAKRLYDDLLSNYNKLVRPVKNTTDPLTVRIKLKLSQLIDVVSDYGDHKGGITGFLMIGGEREIV